MDSDLNTQDDVLNDKESQRSGGRLLEPVPETTCFQMHALLVRHADSNLTEE